MPQRRRLGAVAILALLATTAIAGSAPAATLKGKVVHRNARAHSFTIAKHDGRLAAIHATRRPRVGRVVVVTARKLRNGTYAASKVRTVGKTRRVKLRGTVTYVRRAKRLFTLSSRGVSLVVHRQLRGRRARSASDDWPAVGKVVTVTAQIDDDGDIEEQDIEHEGDDDDGIEIEGHILAIDTTARTLTVTADDEDEAKGTLLVHVPQSFDLSKFAVGQEIEIRATLQPDGSFLLVGAASDDDEDEADDADEQQGVNDEDDDDENDDD